MGFPAFFHSTTPVPYFLPFRHFTPKISIFDLSVSDTCEHSARRYACPQALYLHRFQRIAVFRPLTFQRTKTEVAIEIRNGESEANQGMEISFHYPYNEKYGMFAYVMRR